MKTIIDGEITLEDLEDADLLAGITPTSFLTNGEWCPPAEAGLPTTADPICTMRDRDGAIKARDYTLCHQADAVICRRENTHLSTLARKYGLPVHEV